jgi:endonuclease YncB( thermonuclease family)
VASILDGKTLELTDGRAVRLIGIKAPSAPLGWTGDGPWPFVTEAKAALSKLASGATVELHFDARCSDRHDHVLAQVYVVRGETKEWVQEALVAEGLARVYSFADTRGATRYLALMGLSRAGCGRCEALRPAHP